MGMLGLIFSTFSTIAVIAVTLLCWYNWKYRRILALARKLPTGTIALPLLGHSYFALKGSVGMFNIAVKVAKHQVAQAVHSIVFWLGPCPLFIIMDSEDVQTVLNSRDALNRGPEVEFAEYFMGNGLLTAKEHIWKVTRRHINPMFNPRNLELLMPNLNIWSRRLSTRLTEQASKGPIDIEHHVFPTVFKFACDLVFGPSLTTTHITSENLLDALKVIVSVTQLVVVRAFSVWLWPDIMFRYLYRKEIKENFSKWRRFLQLMIKGNNEQYRHPENHSRADGLSDKFEQNSLVEKEDSTNNIGSQGGCNQITLPDVYKGLQRTYPSFTNEDFEDELFNMVAASSDTSRITVSSCLLALAANPHIQERLYQEIVSVVDCQDSDVTLQNIKDMPYLDQVIKETLRKFVIIPIVTRKLQGDIKLSNFILPAGATVGVLLNGVHFDPRYYPQPEKFDPDRFIPENVAKRPAHAFVPFGGGPRNCIGKTYAMMSMKTILVHIISKIKVSTSVDIDNLTYVGGMATSAAHGYYMEVEVRG